MVEFKENLNLPPYLEFNIYLLCKDMTQYDCSIFVWWEKEKTHTDLNLVLIFINLFVFSNNLLSLKFYS